MNKQKMEELKSETFRNASGVPKTFKEVSGLFNLDINLRPESGIDGKQFYSHKTHLLVDSLEDALEYTTEGGRILSSP